PKRTLLKVLDVGNLSERGAILDQLESNALAILGQMKWVLEPEALALWKRRPTGDLYALTLWGRAMNLYYGYSGPRDLKQAEKTLKKACLIDPKFAEAHRALGLVYLEMNERQKASSQYSYALDLKPGYYAAMIGLARFYRAES